MYDADLNVYLWALFTQFNRNKTTTTTTWNTEQLSISIKLVHKIHIHRGINVVVIDAVRRWSCALLWLMYNCWYSDCFFHSVRQVNCSTTGIQVTRISIKIATATITIIILTTQKSRHQEQRLGKKKRMWKGRECIAQTKKESHRIEWLQANKQIIKCNYI